MSITNTKNHATISTTEWSLTSNSAVLGAMATIGYLSVRLDLHNLAAGDEFRLRLYDKVNGGAQIEIDRWEVVGAASKLLVVPLIPVAEGWEVSLVKVTGADRDIAWSLLYDDALTMNAGAEVIEGAFTRAQLERLFAGMLAGAPVAVTGGSVAFKSLDGTKTRGTITYDATGRLTFTPGDLS